MLTLLSGLPESDSLTGLKNQDGGRTSEYLKLLPALFAVMPTHDLKVEMYDMIQIYLRSNLKRYQPLKNIQKCFVLVVLGNTTSHIEET